MFCVTPVGDNRFYVSCSDHDIEYMKKLIVHSDLEHVNVEICKVMEIILENGTKLYEKT